MGSYIVKRGELFIKGKLL